MRVNWNGNGGGDDKPDPKQVASALLDRLQMAIERKIDEAVGDVQAEVWDVGEQLDELNAKIDKILQHLGLRVEPNS
jgi:hypothetical protein